MDSILNSIKKLLGITEEYTHFDQDIIMHINSVFMILNQIGIGPDKCFTINDKTTKWDEFIQEEHIEAVKTYMYMKVRLMFDPPSSSVITEAIKKNISELEWRLSIIAEIKKATTENQT